jgi:hypothetical protein
MEQSDMDQLRGEFPDWQIGSIWATAATAPDARRLYAQRGTVLLTAWEAAELAAIIRYEERDGT